ncbi:RHS repeat domain-containing protein [Kitasatospora sp. NPDC058965]|uniref:RHS repeat domain-containing protein n=1 Tax=Kitasatospora sp. NPDC058965 TaxID=3346682 RepID=UPI0036952489
MASLVAQVGITATAVAAPSLTAAAPKPDLGSPVKVTPVKPKPLTRPAPPTNHTLAAPSWPAGSAVSLPLIASKSSSAGSPVWGQALADDKGSYAGPSSLDVKVLDHTAAQSAGVNGVLAELTPGAGGQGQARIGIDYSSFSQAFGGDYASRLRLVSMPACALTTPQVPACRVQTPLATTNDVAAKSLSTTLPLKPAQVPSASSPAGGAVKAAYTISQASAAAAAPMVIAATASPSSGDGGGAGGQFGATSLKPSGSWSSGGSTGSFDYTYPIAVPPAVTALSPTIGLSYDSGSIDGTTASTQAQSSWIGDGWSTADSFIEQSFVSCADSPEGVTLPLAQQTGDMCYDGPILTLSLNGVTSAMVWDSSHNTWKPANDNGSVIAHVTNSGNGSGTYNTDYWTVTERNGTVFTFGRNQLPGWTSGSPTTNSVDTEPVYSASPGDPCYSSSGFASSVCTTAYRWHLDYVKDLHGGAMSYYYKQDTNYYGENNGTSNVPYTRDSHLDHIDYGFADGNAYGTVADKVVYTPGERCVSGTCDPLNASNAANWPDVPFDLICAQGATCTSYSPSFFSTTRLTGIATQQWNGSAYNTVDSWALGQSIPTTGTYNTSTLWLNSITHTGADTTAGGSAVTLPQVTFSPIMMANRVNYTTGIGAGLGPFNRYRLNTITTETGSVISVTYGLADGGCTATSIQSLNPATNGSSCFPVVWTPSGYSSPYTDWFNKYVVKSVSQSDPAGGSAGLYTSYTYLGPAAWHYDTNETSQAKYRTYGQWRGYGDVQTRTGQGADPLTLSESWFYRGMDGDWLSPTSTRAVTLTDSQGGVHTDSNQLAGSPLESAAYTYDGGSVDHSTINSYWVSGATATRARTGLPPLTSNAMGQVETWTRQAITSSSPTTWRTTETDVTFDTSPSSPTFALELFSDFHGDLSLAGTAFSQETCTQTSYAPANTSLNLTGLVAETEEDDKPCGGTSPAGASSPTAAQTNALTAPTLLNKATDVIADTRTFYDNPTMAGTWPQSSAPTWPQATPTLGDASIKQDAIGYSSGAFSYQTKTATVYDGYGRPITAYDGDGHKTTTGYTTTSYLTTTGITATNALGQHASTVLDPERALTLTSTDVNGVVTTLHADGLGRTLAVWKDSRATNQPANELYTYTFPSTSTAPVAVTTQVMNDETGYATSTTLFDSLLRVRQTQRQAVTAAAGRIISDSFYDSHGWTYKTNANYWDNTTNPNTTLGTPADNKVHQQTLTYFDGLGRPTIVNMLDQSQVQRTSYAAYLGDRTISVPPIGAVATATLTDALGRTSELDQYSATPTVTTNVAGGFTTVGVSGGSTQATRYTFNALGRPSTTTDPLGATWTTSYDYLGQPNGKTDPDSGATPANSPTLYDADGNILQSTDSAGHTLSYTYDALNRKTAAYDAPVTGQSSANQVSAWVYDNSNNAVPGMAFAIGHVTTQTSFTPAGAFIVQAQGFNTFGESLGEAYTVPGTTSLSGTYTYRHSYTSTVGRPTSTLIPAAGGMSSEILTTGYSGANGLDVPTTFGGTHGYAQNVFYTALGQVAQELVGSATNQATVGNTYDNNTGKLTEQKVINTAVSSTPLDDISYVYDTAGNISSQSDVRNGLASETQCYTYDQLDRLTQAWTTAAGPTANSCSTQPTSANVTSTVGDGTAGSAYWTSWTYDAAGQPRIQTQHSLTAGTDTTTNYTYGGSAAGCPTTAGLHTLATATTTGGSSANNTYCYNGLGATTSRTTPSGQQSLTWNDQGQLQSATTGSNITSYYYDASGSVIERTDPGTTTLFLPDQQLTLNTSTGSVANTRTYALPGGGQAVLTNSGYGFELADQHGSGTISLDSDAKNPSWRQLTPFGAPRGPAPGGSWLDPNGFLGKAQDPNDALTTVGAREYDTTLGRFISLDPVLETDPQQLNGYTYASSNPITYSDPTGLDNWWADPTVNTPTQAGGTPISQDLAHEQGFGALCTAATCSSYNQKQVDDDRAAAAAAAAAEAKARAEAAAKAKAEADAKAAAEKAHRHCAWYDVVCQAEVHSAALLTAALVIAAVAAVIVVCVLAPEIAVAAASAFGEALFNTGGSLLMASIAGAAAGVSTAATGAGLTTLAIGAAVVANLAGAGSFGAGGGEPAGASGSAPKPSVPPVIYRGGTTAPSNLKLRPGEQAVSFRDSLSNPLPPGTPVLHPGKPYIAIDTSKLPAGSVVPDGVPGSADTPPGHVSVYVDDWELIKAAKIDDLSGKFPKE